MTPKPKVYAAGPLGFTPYGSRFQAEICDRLSERGYEPLDPWASPANAFFRDLETLPARTERVSELVRLATSDELGGEPAIRHAVDGLQALPGDERATLSLLNLVAGGLNDRMIEQCDFVLACLDDPDGDIGTASEIGYAAALGKGIVGLRTDVRRTGDDAATIVNLQVEWFIYKQGGRIVRTLDAALDCLDGLRPS